MGYFGGSYKGNPRLKERRDAIRAYWQQYPTARAVDVGALFGVSERTASEMKPSALKHVQRFNRQGISFERADIARKMYEQDATLAEIVDAVGVGLQTVRRYLRGLM